MGAVVCPHRRLVAAADVAAHPVPDVAGGCPVPPDLRPTQGWTCCDSHAMAGRAFPFALEVMVADLRRRFPKVWAIISNADGTDLRVKSLASYLREHKLDACALTLARSLGAALPDGDVDAFTAAGFPDVHRIGLQVLCDYLHGDGGGLEVRASLVKGAGQGLFATRSFAAGELLCVYSGTSVPVSRVLKGEVKSDYIMGGFGLYSVDAASHLNVLARYVNDNFNTAELNAKFVKLKSQRRALVLAIRDVAAGDEIYAAYGESYWRARGMCTTYDAPPPA